MRLHALAVFLRIRRMKKLLISLALATSLAPAVAFACPGEGGKVNTVNAAEAGKLNQSKKATFVDANGKDTREKFGVVPGAILLTSASEYAATELPSDKSSKLVFYCANNHCSASHKAAGKAMEQGYTDVAVLPEGIAGWKEAGLPTVAPAAPAKVAAPKAKTQS